MTQSSIRIRLVVEPDDDTFFGWSPELAGVLVEGDTKEEAEQLLREATLLHLETMIRNNMPLPQTLIAEKPQFSESDYTIQDRKFLGSVIEDSMILA